LRITRRLHRELKPGGLPARRVLPVGDEEPMARLARELRGRPAGEIQVVGMLNGATRRKGPRKPGGPALGAQTEPADARGRVVPDEILVAMPDASAERREQVLKECRALHRSARLAPDLSRLLLCPESPKLSGDYNPEDLLFREAIRTDGAFARAVVGGRCV